MPAVIVSVVVLCFGGVGLLSWRLLGIAERVRVERERAGGQALARTVTELGVRVAQMESYLSGTDYKEIQQR